MTFAEIRRTFRQHLALYRALYDDSRTPRISRMFLWLAIGYLFMPFDLIPDFIPILGQLDDIVIIPLLLYLAVSFIPKDIYREHYARLIAVRNGSK